MAAAKELHVTVAGLRARAQRTDPIFTQEGESTVRLAWRTRPA